MLQMGTEREQEWAYLNEKTDPLGIVQARKV